MRTLLFLVLFVGFLPQAEAQDTRVLSPTVMQPSSDLDIVKYVVTQGRRRVFENAMKLNKQDSEIFWTVYAEYEREHGQVDQKGMKLLETYLKNVSVFTNEQSIQFTNELATLQQETIALRAKYFRILSEKLSGVTAARFYQVDDYVTAATKLDLLDNLPFIGELSRR